MKKFYAIAIFLLLTLMMHDAWSQRYRAGRQRNFTVNIGSGVSMYFGDLAAKNDYSNIHFNIVGGGRYNFADRFSVSSDLTYFMLTGDDTKDPVKANRNLSFRSSNIEFNVLFQSSVFPENVRFYQRKPVNPYVFAGIGFVWFSPKAKLDGTWHNLRNLRTERINYSSFSLAVPVGLGVRFKVTPFLNVNLDLGYRFVTTDYLDDVSSGIYPGAEEFNTDLERRLSDRSWEVNDGVFYYRDNGINVRGNPDANDGYFLGNVRVEYYLSNVGGRKQYKPRKTRGYRPGKAQKSRRYKPPKRRRR